MCVYSFCIYIFCRNGSLKKSNEKKTIRKKLFLIDKSFKRFPFMHYPNYILLKFCIRFAVSFQFHLCITRIASFLVCVAERHRFCVHFVPIPISLSLSISALALCIQCFCFISACVKQFSECFFCIFHFSFCRFLYTFLTLTVPIYVYELF